MRLFLTLLLLSLITFSQAQKTAFELDSNITGTYSELIQFYKTLASKHDQSKLSEMGITDSGNPLHLMVLSKDKIFSPAEARKRGKQILLIINGIHPGEPEGMDAAAMLSRDLLKANALPKDLVICIVPVYNIGGMLNRGISRANQNGPNEYGFRGNAKNYDLNRDFIKTDSKNSLAFQEIFQKWQPDLFVDTHTSNGADYQHIITLIDTQNDKLNPELRTVENEITKSLFAKMKQAGFTMTPYVDSFGETPESGLVSFLESARYSTGYAALHHTVGYMPEAHMWKAYYLRVRGTYALLKSYISLDPSLLKELSKAKIRAEESAKIQTEFPLAWKVDTTHFETIEFLGYEASKKESLVTGGSRLFYDHEKPFTKTIRHYNKFEPTMVVTKPKAYILPQTWTKAIELLKLNGVQMKDLEKDQKMEVEVYYIDSYNSTPSPYEGHYLHSNVKLLPKKQMLQFYKGDFVIETNQKSNRFIVETLEPQAPDSYFNWNFFDSVLGQKEYFSSYIFEEEAYRLVNENPALKKEFENLKNEDPKFKNNPRAQLDWIYKQSPYFEKTYKRYPVARVLN